MLMLRFSHPNVLISFLRCVALIARCIGRRNIIRVKLRINISCITSPRGYVGDSFWSLGDFYRSFTHPTQSRSAHYVVLSVRADFFSIYWNHVLIWVLHFVLKKAKHLFPCCSRRTRPLLCILPSPFLLYPFIGWDFYFQIDMSIYCIGCGLHQDWVQGISWDTHTDPDILVTF